MRSVDRLGEVHIIEYLTLLANGFAYLAAYSARVNCEVLQKPQCNRWIESSRNQNSNRDHGLVGNCFQKGNALHFEYIKAVAGKTILRIQAKEEK